ncbi:hypothetical protein QAD02_019335 [Eretmocerus hayati]|uniref:Uncharacterized protein n=1 Tax=Eretmocerus hayati TaxID=131215 RepID=A0ACC2PJB0_9HYME|nr:hypothetical protein QAD02_019335 [Eretmocerus hayati]
MYGEMIIGEGCGNEAIASSKKKSPKARMNKAQMQLVKSYIQQHYNEVADEWIPSDGRTETELWDEMANSLRRDGTSVTRALTLDDWKKHVANYIRRKKCEPGGLYGNTKASEKSPVRSEKVENRKRLCYEVCEEIPVKRERCAGWAACSTNKPALLLGVINGVSNHGHEADVGSKTLDRVVANT